MKPVFPFLLWISLVLFAGKAGIAAESPPKVDLNVIINTSYSFLKNREPEMTGAEYALYEKIVGMASTNPEFAMKLVEGMAAANGPASAAFEFVIGNICYNGQRFADAERHYKAALAKYPDYVRCWTNLGILNYGQQRFAEAIPFFTKAVSLGDRDGSTLGLLATCQSEVGNTVMAEITFQQAMTADPNNPDWLRGLLELYLKHKYYAQAESLVKQLIRINTKDVQHWLVYANVLIAQNHKPEAIAALETIRTIGALDEGATGLLGDLYADQHLYAEAAAVYESLLAKSPDVGTQRLLTYAEVLIGQGEYRQANEVLARLADTAPARLQRTVRRARGEVASARGDWETAKTIYEQIAAEEPMRGDVLLALGDAYKNLGDLGRAQLAFEQALQVKDVAYQANVQLANLAVSGRKFSDAINYLTHALALQRTSALADYLEKVQALQALVTP